MSVPVRVISPEAVPVARRLYEETGVPMQVIADTIGINRRTLVRWVKDGAWTPRSRRLPRVTPSPAEAAGTPELPPAAGPAALDETMQGSETQGTQPQDAGTDGAETEAVPRRALIARLVRRIETEIAAIERLVGATLARKPEAAGADTERAARTLAVLVRALRELAALDKAGPDEDEDDASRDADAFRRELGDTLERVLAGREAS